MKSFDLQFFADKMNRGEPFSIGRYGDGELFCMEGREGGNSQGCEYTPELRADLLRSLDHKDEFYHLVSSTMLPADKIRFAPFMKQGVEWGDTEIFPEGIKSGEMKNFFDAARKHKIIVISSKEKRKLPIPYSHFIETPYCNSHAEKARIIGEIQSYGQPGVYLFSCGMAAGVFTYDLYGSLPSSWFLDIGHVVDPLIGVTSRGYLEELTHEQIFRNI